jgi:hypothetical protein
MKVGDLVRLPKHGLRRYGHVVWMDDRFAYVKVTYGRRVWRRHYTIKELEWEAALYAAHRRRQRAARL